MNSPVAGIRLLLLGATGAVGQQVLRLALEDGRVAQVTAPTRRPLTSHSKLRNPVTDFSALPDAASVWDADAVICALGSTIRKAGSEAAFATVDRDLPIAIAKHARAAGARSFALNSSLGASHAGNFYLRTKAQVEDGIRQLGFPSYTIVRPSLINARRTETRPAERVGLTLANLLAPLIPRRYRPVSAEAIAVTLLRYALDATPGERIIESEAINS
jgi:uncharacterized protein YbjT (DUF2867 family)